MVTKLSGFLQSQTYFYSAFYNYNITYSSEFNKAAEIHSQFQRLRNKASLSDKDWQKLLQYDQLKIRQTILQFN